MAQSWSSENDIFETSKILVDESAIFKGMISFDRKPRPTHRWSTSLMVKRVALHNERLRSRIWKTMSWILSNNKNMANVPPTTNEIRINRKETQKKLSKHINSPLFVEVSPNKNETVHI